MFPVQVLGESPKLSAILQTSVNVEVIVLQVLQNVKSRRLWKFAKEPGFTGFMASYANSEQSNKT